MPEKKKKVPRPRSMTESVFEQAVNESGRMGKTAPASAEAFRELLAEGHSVERIALMTVTSIQNVLTAFMDAIPRAVVPTDVQWQVITLSTVLNNMEAALAQPQLASLQEMELTPELTAALDEVVKPLMEAIEKRQAENAAEGGPKGGDETGGNGA